MVGLVPDYSLECWEQD